MRRVLIASLLLTACGNDVVPTGDDASTPTTEPVFYGQVQRIFNDNCVSCHSEDPDRLAPFALVKYEDAVAAATDFPMAYDVMNRVMPPFYADQNGDCGSFRDAHWMTDDELDTLLAWINGGKLEGNPADTVAPPPPPGGLAQVDHTVDTNTSFTISTDQPDTFACFVVDSIGADKFVVGAHVKPGNLTVAHHVILFTLDQAAEDDAVAKQAAAGGSSYRCDGGPTQAGEAKFLVGWVPGNQATVFPPSTGIRVDGARKMVVQMHYNSAHSDGRTDRTTIDLDLADSVQVPAQMARISGNVNLPPQQIDATSTGTVTIPNALPSARIWGSGVHMHQRGTAAKLTVASDNDRCLMDLVNWSFHWQHFYWFEEPVALDGGDTIKLTCHYDTTGDTQNIGFCETTDCEMCIQYAYVTQ
ncbi:MAG: hypothetical protein H0V17_30770 [Deltaproteobacteria bacterium]|nr:hypothetical protein [Deltaproteobacteria bacterium]